MKNKFENIQNTKANIDFETDWVNKPFSHPERTIRIGTSFSGIGAIEHAFVRLGLNTKIMFAGDIDENCKKSYFANYKISDEQWHSDIHELDANTYKGNIDLFVGGAPCQAFSMRGKRGGFEDTRGTLFREFARIVIECQPKVFIFENVKGMLNHDSGNTWRTIKRTFEDDCDYDVYYQILNGKDYGIPQSRDRIFCIGFKKETCFKYPHPIQLKQTVFDLLDKEFDGKYLLHRKGVHFITESINHQKSYTQINGDIQLCQKRNQQFNWHGDFIFHPLSSNDPATPETDDTVFDVSEFEETYFMNETVSKYSIQRKGDKWIMDGSSNVASVKYGRYRKLTPSECLKLMGFDKNFIIPVSDTEAYKQSGNSIIVDVLIALLKQMDITQYGVEL